MRRAIASWALALSVAGCTGSIAGSADGGAVDGRAGATDGSTGRDGGRPGDGAARPGDGARRPDDAGARPADRAVAGEDASAPADAPAGGGEPPFGGSSGGSSGEAPVAGEARQTGGVTYWLGVPAAYRPGTPAPLLIGYSANTGGARMMQGFLELAAETGTAQFIFVALDGNDYAGDGDAGAAALDDVRRRYDIDNDRTYLLGESAGTTGAFALGFHLRPSYFAAYWANDIVAEDGPVRTAAELGFAPFGQVGPGGRHEEAARIVDRMRAAGYRLDAVSPYDGPGADEHGSWEQFTAAVAWFPGKARR